MNTTANSARHIAPSLELLRLVRKLDEAVQRMDAFSAWASGGNRSVLAPHYNAVIRAADELHNFMK